MKRYILALIVLSVFVPTVVFAGGEAESTSPAAKAQSKATTITEYPQRPVEFTCIFGAGSAADLIARKFAELAEPVLGQPAPVVNRTGGGQSVGYNHVKDQKPDGYSVIWTSNGLFTAYYQGNIDFASEAFEHICQVSFEPVSIAVAYDSPWETIEDFAEYIKANPGKVRIGNSGVGTFTHMTAAAIENVVGGKVVHVPFGQGLAFASLLGGQIEASVQLPSEVIAQHEAKQVRILALSSAQRIDALPDVPTLMESGIRLNMTLWRGLAVPKGTPEDVVRKLEATAQQVVESPEFQEFADTMSIIPSFVPSEQFSAFVYEDGELTGTLMKTIGTSKR